MYNARRRQWVPLALCCSLVAVQACALEAPVVPSSAPAVATSALPHDLDGDGLDDVHERALGLDPAQAELDSDGDGLPDHVEVAYGLNPRSVDSDGDGFNDLYEHARPHHDHADRFPGQVIGAGSGNVIAPGALNYAIAQADGSHRDSDGDGTHNGLDPDGNNNGIPDAQEDADGDGVPNGLEIHGYHYDPFSQTFKAGDHPDGRAAWKTDPLMKSSDLDPYSDGAEAKGIPIPGVIDLNPCKSLYPQLAMEVTQLAWTPSGQITFTNGQSVSSEQTQETSTEHTTSTETSSELNNTVTAEVSAEFGTDGFNGGVSVSDSVSWGSSTTNSSSTSTSIANSSTIGKSTDWSTATTTDLQNAATLKLTVRFVNNGNAQLLNVLPTIDVAIGNRQVFTIQPPLPIQTLGVSRSTNAFQMTIDKDATGAPLTLNFEELKLLQSGAPLRATLSQFSGELQAPDPDAEVLTYKSLGQWASYQDSIDLNTTELLLDDGKGKVAVARAYSPRFNPATSPPVVTMRDAFMWAFGGVSDGGHLKVTPNPDAPETRVAVNNWFFFGTPRLFQLSMSKPEYQGNMLAMPLRGGVDSVLVKAAPTTDFQKHPNVLSAKWEPEAQRISVVAQDYIGIKSVELKGATDYFFGDFHPPAASPYNDKSRKLFYWNSDFWSPIRMVVFDWMYNAGWGHDHLEHLVNGFMLTHEGAAAATATKTLAPAPFRDGPNQNFAMLGWALSGYDVADLGSRTRIYVGPRFQVPENLPKGETTVFWGFTGNAFANFDSYLAWLHPERMSAQHQAWYQDALKKRKAIDKASMTLSNERYVLLVTNTRGNASYFDLSGNFLGFKK